ncbi:hypothetical protein HDU91_006702 [Kappamyces sp. JEL0680]|nr:hypothetical protein HDU91_006702 [Kappamyces sp. JEL0680]
MSDSAKVQAELEKVNGKLEEVETEITEVKKELKEVKVKLDKAEAKLEKAQAKYEQDPNAINKELKGDAKDIYNSVNQQLHDLNQYLQRLGQKLSDLNQKETALRQLETELVKKSGSAGTGVSTATEERMKSLEESQKKFEETFNKYIQKVSTVQISSLTFDTIDKDGYRCVAQPVFSPINLGFDVPAPFEWPVPEKEADIRNTSAYLEYLNEVVKDYNHLKAQNSIEHPHLNTTVGKTPHNLNGKADLYIMPKACISIARNQLCAVVELKPGKKISDYLAQAVGYVIAADSLFEVDWRPSPVGILSDFMDQWILIWIGSENVVNYMEAEIDSHGNTTPLSRGTALYYVRKHFARYNQMLNDEYHQKDSQKRKAEDDSDIEWAFGDFKAGRLKKTRLVAEDNMRDLIEDEEELRFYDMRKRMENTPLFQIPPPAESHLPYFN